MSYENDFEHERIVIDVPAGDSSERELDLLRRALGEDPPRIPSRYFYDARGSRLFERITELPEYYQTRTERALLEQVADQIALDTGADELVELGSGAATKTRVLLDAMKRAGRLRLYVPFDVSASTVRQAALELTSEYDGLRVHGVVGNFMEDLGDIPPGSKRLVAFLGGTIGNLKPDTEAVHFLASLAAHMEAGDFLLLGTDLLKNTEILHAAYNDSEGVTAEFNKNSLLVLNHRFGASFDPEQFRHQACFLADLGWIEMRLIATAKVSTSIPAASTQIELAPGEHLLTEISAKYNRSKVERLLDQSGFALSRWFTDPNQWFALSLAVKLK